MRVPVALGLILLLPLVAGAQEAPVNGADIFKKCLPCHAIGPDAAHKIGPQLNGILEQPVGAQANFNYSATLQRAGAAGDIWTSQRLGLYLKNSRHAYPGTSMAFAGLRQRADIEAVIDYMAGFAADGSTLP